MAQGRRAPERATLGKGFDLAEQQTAMVVPDVSFLEGFHAAKVFACAYGLHRPPGFSAEIPTLTLVGENRDALVRAFEAFRRWGCEDDGDCVDLHIMLSADGSYAMWIGPEIERLMHRSLPNADLYRRPGVMGLSYVKRFDTTHKLLRELKPYRASALSPIAISAATCDPKNPTPANIRPLNSLPRLVKFDLEIVDERDTPDHPRFKVMAKGRAGLGAPKSPPSLQPSDYCALRRRTLDIAFPVSRERVRRSDLVSRVRAITGFEAATDTQVLQAAINVCLSNEISPGDDHFRELSKRYRDVIWAHVFERFETANARKDPGELDPIVVAQQIECDVRHVIKQARGGSNRASFAATQARFKRMGYVDD